MDSTKIEGKAVRYVKEILDDCPLLSSSDIKDGDKEISWDGFVKIFNSEQHTKDNLLGRVFVQIKGKKVNDTDLINENISYAAEVSDLHNYQKDGGIIYMVVYIAASGERHIFYETLTVVKLKDYLKDIKSEQKNKSLRLRSLPKTASEIETVFINFYEDAKKQSSFANKELLTLEELTQQPGFKGFTITTSKRGKKPDNIIDQAAAIVDNEMYAYAKIGDFEIPASNGISKLIFKQTIDKPITVDGIEYYSSCNVIVRNKEQRTIQFGKTIEFTIFDDGRIDLFKHKQSKLHGDLLQSLKFMTHASQYHQFNIGDAYFKLTENSGCNNQKEIDRYIELLTKIDKLLHKLNIQEQIDLSGLSSQDYRNLLLLYEGIVEEKLLPDLIVENNGPTSYNIPCSNLKIKILITPKREESGNMLYRIEDYFSLSHHVIGHKRDDNKYYVLSPYLILEPDEYGNVSNMDYKKLVNDAKDRLSVDKEIYHFVNATLLNLLLAYDKKHSKSLLVAAENLARLLIECETPGLSKDAKTINLLQTIKRYRKFTEQEELSLIEIRENCPGDFFAKIAVSLLLDDTKSAKFYFRQIESQEDKALFNKLPIHRFWK